MGHTVLQLPVRALEPLVRRHLLDETPSLTAPDPATVCAHITLLGPFVHHRDVDAELLAALSRLLASAASFEFELTRIRSFPSGPVYLAPDPAEPLRHLTERLTEAFPAWLPYGGAFDEVVPHLSIGHDLTPGERAELELRLPIPVRAEVVDLTWWSPTSVRTLVQFPLGPELLVG